MYAIIESGYWSTDEDELRASNIFTPFSTLVEVEDGAFVDHQLFLVGVDAFISPLIVVPDIGGMPNAFFAVKNQSQWKENFEEWLDAPHNSDDMSEDV